jgi:Response regulator receiver domain
MLEIKTPDQRIGAVLWLDNEVNHFVAQKRKLQRRGIEVHEARTIEKAYDIIASSEIDLCIVDLKLRSENEGIEFIELVQEKHPQLGFLVYSQYSHLPSLAEQLKVLGEKLGGRLWNLPKGRTPSVNTVEFDNVFVSPVESLVKGNRPVTPAMTTFTRRSLKNTKFEIPLGQFMKLAPDDKIHLLTEFRQQHTAIIDELFKEGYIWVLFLGDDDIPLKKEKDHRKILSDSAIASLA